MSQGDRRLAQGEWVLVTGANGFIASHVIDVLLEQGYNVRGTVRNEKAWLNQYFENKYGTGRFETHILTTMDQKSAFDEAVKGVSGIVHLVRSIQESPLNSAIMMENYTDPCPFQATDVSFGTDANIVVPKVVAGTVNMLESAAKEASVKSVLLTSSSSAALIPEPNKKGVVVDESKRHYSSMGQYEGQY